MTLDSLLTGGLFDFAGKVIEKIFPDPAKADAAKLELFKLQQSGELAQLAAETDLAKGQLAINVEEAKNASVFVSGWRPFVGWVGGVGLAYAAILEPVARFCATVFYGYVGIFPVLDTTITMQILFGLLGLGAMRSYDKKQGTATK
jgi:hypothetical protein